MGAAALPIAIGSSVAGGVMSAYGGAQAAKSTSDYYGYLAGNARINARLAAAKADSDRRSIGYQEGQQERQLGEKVRATIGAQKAALAAGGAGVGSKTAEQIVSDTMDRGNLDEEALRYNADAKGKAAQMGSDVSSMNFRTEAYGDQMSGAAALGAEKFSRASTILGTGGSVASMWYRLPTSWGGAGR
jgi:hypothetical protein